MAGVVAKSSRVIVPNQPKWFQRLGAGMIFFLEHILMATFRVQWEDPSGRFAALPQAPVIFCIWHNRLGLSMFIFRKYVRDHRPSRKLAALISASKDGAFLASILENFGVQPVRGSSSRRGPQALLELTTWVERGYDLAITPDGPRGPRYVVQEGVMALAQLTGTPIVPVSYHASSKIVLNSWDRFQIPSPFARCRITFGEAMYVPREATGSEREALRQQLQEAMIAMTQD